MKFPNVGSDALSMLQVTLINTRPVLISYSISSGFVQLCLPISRLVGPEINAG